ncbi:30S ribosomal protein S6e [uncultured archaeon]|nr:30S ribosomal protein S6e [uncultured archaeon]
MRNLTVSRHFSSIYIAVRLYNPTMEFKVVVSDPTAGKSYQKEVKDEAARKLRGINVGEEIDGAIIGLEGYKLAITGGSDRSGFPMKQGVHGSAAARVLMDSGVGYNPKRVVRTRKRVRGERIDEDITQVNTIVVKAGKKTLEELLGAPKEAAAPKEE